MSSYCDGLGCGNKEEDCFCHQQEQSSSGNGELLYTAEQMKNAYKSGWKAGGKGELLLSPLPVTRTKNGGFLITSIDGVAYQRVDTSLASDTPLSSYERTIVMLCECILANTPQP